MKPLAALFCIAVLGIAGTLDRAEAETQPQQTWAQQKRAQLRAEVTYLRIQNRSLVRTLRHRPSVQEALRLASITYGQNLGTLRRVAWCESRYNPRAKNRRSSARGLFQHLYPSTWRTTPYAGESVWSPYAASMAAAWMFRQGRANEWVCF